jgi:endonuclease VIII-like 1
MLLNMPEGPEVKIMSGYINRVSEGIVYSSVYVERKKNFPLIDIEEYTLSSKTRGKEMRLKLKNASKRIYLRINLGMSGCFKMYKNIKDTPAGTAISFIHSEGVLAFVDVRRFARCTKDRNWGEKRGPCVLDEYHEFKKNLRDNMDRRIFDKEIYLLILNQTYFNGIGNYLRAEIIYRWGFSPYMSSREAVMDDDFVRLCHKVTKKAYKLGGAELYTWQTPDGFAKNQRKWDKFMKCYKKPGMKSIEGPQDRKFWYSPGHLTPIKQIK